jgi:amino acid transporter
LKWTLIRGKRPSAIAAAIPTVVAFVVAMTVIVTVGVVLTSTGCILAVMRRQSRLNRVLSDRYMLPEGQVDFHSRSAPSNTVTRV